MTDNTNESQAEPSFYELLALSGLAPERWIALDDARKQEWIRVWHAKKAGLHG
jgi:hypothetical protein